MSDCVANYEGAKAAMASACVAWKRLLCDVELLAVSKNFGCEAILPLLAAGQRIFGENRVQEAAEKWPRLREQYGDVRLHLLGALQSNKVEAAVGLFDVIQTVDREKIARLLGHEMVRQGRFLPCFIQVNIGEEEQKSGILPRELGEFLAFCKHECGLAIEGIMVIPPLGENCGPYFALAQTLVRRHGLRKLSAGMSADFELAIAFGTNCVRLGRRLFGER